MQIEVQARHFSLTQAISEHVKKRLGFALNKRYDQIKRILVNLSDINGPRGGKDKRCRILIKIAGQSDVIIEDVQSNLYVAVDRAAGRAARTVTRKLSRVRDKALRSTLTPDHPAEVSIKSAGNSSDDSVDYSTVEGEAPWLEFDHYESADWDPNMQDDFLDATLWNANREGVSGNAASPQTP